MVMVIVDGVWRDIVAVEKVMKLSVGGDDDDDDDREEEEKEEGEKLKKRGKHRKSKTGRDEIEGRT